MVYSFHTDHASEYGVDEAIVIYNLLFWIAKNKANGVNEYDGNTYTYNSINAFRSLFPFWSERQIGRILKSLETQNVVKVGNYNKAKYDRHDFLLPRMGHPPYIKSALASTTLLYLIG